MNAKTEYFLIQSILLFYTLFPNDIMEYGHNLYLNGSFFVGMLHLCSPKPFNYWQKYNKF